MKTHMLHERLNFLDMRNLIEWAAEEHAGKYAYSFRPDYRRTDVVRVTFGTLRDDVRGLTTKLLRMGVRGKKCAVIGKLSYEWAVLYFSILSAGAVIVPLDRDWQGEELASTCDFADVNFLFCDGDNSDKAEIISKNIKKPLTDCGYMIYNI